MHLSEVPSLSSVFSEAVWASDELVVLVRSIARMLRAPITLLGEVNRTLQAVPSHWPTLTPHIIAHSWHHGEAIEVTQTAGAWTLLTCPVQTVEGTWFGVLCVSHASHGPHPLPDKAALQDAAALLALTLERLFAQAWLQVMIGGLYEGVILVDRTLQLKSFNPQAARLLGAPDHPLTQDYFAALRRHIQGLDGQPVLPEELPLSLAFQTRQPQLNVTLGISLPDGVQRWLEINALPVGTEAVVASFTDVTDSIQFRQALQRELEHDPLTGLPNRVHFMLHLQQALGSLHTQSKAFAVGFVDLDGFKAVNDALGHAAGDHLLREVAGRLSGTIRPGDKVARLAGDEFVILWQGVSDATQANVLGERVVAACAPAYLLYGGEVRVTSSVGVHVVTTGDATAQAVLQVADTAMYQAKRRGKNQCVVWS
jgi:diguanylate cyclase (GGDEF)-like protein